MRERLVPFGVFRVTPSPTPSPMMLLGSVFGGGEKPPPLRTHHCNPRALGGHSKGEGTSLPFRREGADPLTNTPCYTHNGPQPWFRIMSMVVHLLNLLVCCCPFRRVCLLAAFFLPLPGPNPWQPNLGSHPSFGTMQPSATDYWSGVACCVHAWPLRTHNQNLSHLEAATLGIGIWLSIL